jgi:hypothetical protein
MAAKNFKFYKELHNTSTADFEMLWQSDRFIDQCYLLQCPFLRTVIILLLLQAACLIRHWLSYVLPSDAQTMSMAVEHLAGQTHTALSLMALHDE